MMMHIQRLVLHKFKRFFLSGVEHFVYTPESNITVIAWSNGQGKSSLLSQLSPLPADLKKDYREGGYKLLEFTIGSDTYEVSSGYVAPNKHSFIKNGEELNPGGTSTVQKQLVEEHCKLTQAIFNILLGLDNLTTMPPTVRKHWFTMLSPVDYTYSISVWNKLKSRTRDIVGSIKILQEDLIKKTSTLVDTTTLEKLQLESKALEDAVSKLSLEFHQLPAPSGNYDIANLIYSYNAYKFKSAELLSTIGLEYPTVQQLQELKGKVESSIQYITTEQDKKLKVMKSLENLQTKDSMESINSKIFSIQDKLDKVVYTPTELAPARSYVELSDIQDKIRPLLDYLQQPDVLELGNRKTMLELTSKLDNLKQQYLNTTNTINVLKKSLDEYKAKNTDHLVHCPNCDSEFHYHAYKDQIAKIEQELKTLESTIPVLTKQLEELNTTRTKLEHKIICIDKFTELVTNPYIIDYIGPLDTINKDNILTRLNEVRVLIENNIEHKNLTDELKKLEHQYKVLVEVNKLAEDLGISSLDKLEQELQEIFNKKQQLLKQLASIDKYLELQSEISSVLDRISDYVKYRDDLYKYTINGQRNGLLLESIGRLKLQLTTIQKQLLESDSASKLLSTVQSTIETNKTKLDILTNMVTILSPDGGLIAKSINSFLNNYLSEMNSIINSVWSYNMELLPCEVDETNDLNYKFKVKVNHDEVIEDISKLSSSMQEIVNLAFKIVFVKYLGLTGYPLILDEFGRTMDPEHRIKAFDVIDRVLAHNFEQIILVCHFESMYSRFNHAQFLELKEYPQE